MSDYRPNPPTNYPQLWLAQARRAAAAPGDWFDVEVSPDGSKADRRMERLRAFGKGLLQFPGYAPEVAAMLREGYTFRLKKEEKPAMHWKFVVYLSLQPPRPERVSYGELAKKAAEGVDSPPRRG